MTKPRIIFLSQLFDPEPTLKGLAFVKALAAHGFEIEVVTGFPNYPGGKVYPGHRIRPIRREEMEGIAVTRLAIYPSHDRSALRRIACYLSFFFTSLFYLLFRARRADLVYVYYPSLTAGLSAAAAKLFRRTPILLDIQDMWPDSLGATGMVSSRAFLGLVNFFCGLLYRACDHIIVLSPGFRDLLISRGVPAAKISVVYNWTEETAGSEVGRRPAAFAAEDRFRLLFAGNMGAAQDLGVVLEAAQIVGARDPGIAFYFMGSGLELDPLKAQARALGLQNVRFLPRVPMAEVQNYLAAADCLLVHLRDDPLFRVTIPSKTQAYLHAGKPVLMAVRGDAAALIEAAGAGLCATPGDSADIAEKILALAALPPEDLADLGRRGRSYYDQNLSKARGIAQTAALALLHRRAG